MRCFIALDLEPPPGPALASWLDTLRSFRDLSVPPAGNLHLTLAFLGEIDAGGVARATDAVSAAVPRIGRPGTIEWGRPGAFPSVKRPRVLWLGVQEEGWTVAIAALLREELAARNLSVEKRPFQPHLTLARVRAMPPADPMMWREAMLALPTPSPSRATGLALCQSRTGRGSAVYTRVFGARF